MSAGVGADVAVMARVRVVNANWIGELRRAVKLTRRDRSGQAIISFADGQLRTSFGGIEFEIPAEGRWPGEARISADWLRTLAKVPPGNDPLEFSVSRDRMQIAGSSVPCTWQRAGNAKIVLPMGAQLLEILQLPLQHTAAELEASGLAAAVAKAESELLLRMRRALCELAPLGVSREDLDSLVRSHISRISATRPESTS